MSFLGSSKEHDILLSLGSGHVYGAVIDLKKTGPAEVSLSTTSAFPVRQNVTASGLTTQMLAALHTVVTTLMREHKKRIKTVHVVFASPWFSSFSKPLSLKKDTPFTVTEKIIEKLVKDYTESLVKENSSEGTVLIEKAVSHVRLNGYDSANPYGKSAKTLDVSAYTSVVPQALKQNIESEIQTIIHPSNFSFHTFPFACWNVLVKLFSPKEDFAFIDIGSEITDVLIIRQGSIYSLLSIPLGRNHLMRKVAMSFETEPELATGLIDLYSNDSAEKGVKEKLAALVDAFSEEWSLDFNKAVREMENGQDIFLPQKAFFVSDKKVAALFEGVIKKVIPNTMAVSAENISHFVDFGKEEAPNIFLAIEVIYINSRIF